MAAAHRDPGPAARQPGNPATQQPGGQVPVHEHRDAGGPQSSDDDDDDARATGVRLVPLRPRPPPLSPPCLPGSRPTYLPIYLSAPGIGAAGARTMLSVAATCSGVAAALARSLSPSSSPFFFAPSIRYSSRRGFPRGARNNNSSSSSSGSDHRRRRRRRHRPLARSIPLPLDAIAAARRRHQIYLPLCPLSLSLPASLLPFLYPPAHSGVSDRTPRSQLLWRVCDASGAQSLPVAVAARACRSCGRRTRSHHHHQQQQQQQQQQKQQS